MKNKKAIGITVASALALALCGGALVGCGDDDEKPKKLTDSALQATRVADFTTGEQSDREALFASHGFENGDVFNAWWNNENVAYDNNVAELSISAMEEKEQVWNPEYDADEAENNPDYDVPETIDCQANYYGGELRSSKYYGYGDYEVSMKPSNVAGTASTFFVCTGPYDVNYETQLPNPHDEIDIEFLGYDTTFVQFNYFVNGVGGHEYKYKLGFDASKEFHTYGFRWTKDYIVWFVDGKPVYKVNATKTSPMPSTPGRMLANYWTGTEKAEGWMKEFEDDFSGKSQYKYIASSATPQDDPTVAPPAPPVEAPVDGWTDINSSGFVKYTEPYTVSATETEINMSHTAKANAYSCSGMSLSSNYSWVKFKVTNNSDTDAATVRVDIKKQNPSKNGIVAIDSDYAGAQFLNADGAALIAVAAGESAEVACKINSDTITVNQLVVFLNSTNDATATAGDITISELQGITAEPGSDAGTEDAKMLINGEEIAFSGDGYTITPDGDKTSMTVSYEDLEGDSYKFISGNVASVLGENNTFNFKIVNNGSENAKIRIDMNCPQGAVYDVANGTYANLSAELNGLAEGDLISKGSDYQYGGADWFVVKAGGTVTGKILFQTGVDIDMVKFYIDSSTFDDKTTHTGSVTVSEVSFTKEVVEVIEPTLPDASWTAINLAGASAYVPENGANLYEYDVTANSINITHSAKPVAGSNVNVSQAYGQNNKLHMKIKNNAEIAAKFCINVQSPDAGYKTVILKATVDGVSISVPADTYDGVVVEIAANSEIIFECTIGEGANNLCFGLNNTADGETSGDVTVSEICMKAETEQGGETEGGNEDSENPPSQE